MKVMIAPNTVIAAFNHGYSDIDVAMADQENVQKEVVIEDNVWIGANCIVAKGVRIGSGSIVAANSFINKNILPFSIVGGLLAKIIKSRIW